MTTTTEQTTNDLRHSFTIVKGKEKTVIKIWLNDECRNGHEDFSLTADIYEKRGTHWKDVGGGCCHDHILALRSDLKPFAMLHLCTWEGVPMHTAANAFYWFAGFNGGLGKEYHGGSGTSAKTPDECRRIFADHIHATDEQVDQIVAMMPRSEIELRAVLEDMHFPEQWKGEADAAIATLERWTGKKFVSTATRGRWEPLTTEQRAEIAKRCAEGYYDPAQVAKRDAEKAAALKAAKIADIRANLAKGIEKLQHNAQVAFYMAERYFPQFQNVIYYDHTNELAVNWTRGEKLITRGEFDRIVTEADASALPEGIKFTWAKGPKYYWTKRAARPVAGSRPA